MTALEFIKKFGWNRVKEIILAWSKFLDQCEISEMPTHFDLDLEIFVHEDDFCSPLGESNILVDDLKQYVDAYELVQSYGGLEQSKSLSMSQVGLKKHYDELQQAIKLVEQVNATN